MQQKRKDEEKKRRENGSKKRKGKNVNEPVSLAPARVSATPGYSLTAWRRDARRRQ